ncbi:uncharacterized protein VICG_01677 [Vittaforma corneae ATCC 50505]|uniref:Uncharacterized protein n=1 Tax=Vittaforma corneae (strain ATCC 50505) TaxID=993615 RepID=L2GKZ1_VITCO|nr:uncharacterized protein VICG_01677 [Vittaforma corneae ATCC 50505]ELA41304.1 hypothetical protein VICG_01677 [Vittaforma corneae ATCC 50505]
METTHESEQLFLNCRDKGYIRTNIEHLKSYFSSSQNINALKIALTTNSNFTALKIIEQLNLKVIPYIHINTFTFVSIFWLNRMKVIPDDEFESLVKKFEILKNFDVLFEETEKNFITLQIEKRRRVYMKKHNQFNHFDSAHDSILCGKELLANSRMPCKLLSGLFKFCEMITFIFCLDDLVDFEKYVSWFPDFKDNIFWTELKTFESFQDDPQKNDKIYRFRDIRRRLANCTTRSFSQFFKLETKYQERLEELMAAVNKIRKCGFNTIFTATGLCLLFLRLPTFL